MGRFDKPSIMDQTDALGTEWKSGLPRRFQRFHQGNFKHQPICGGCPCLIQLVSRQLRSNQYQTRDQFLLRLHRRLQRGNHLHFLL